MVIPPHPLVESGRRDVVIDGCRLTFVDITVTSAPKPERTCVLVHGLAASLDYWLPTIPALAESHRVIAIDLPGFGRSETHPQAGPMELVRVLAAALDGENLTKVDLIGHSMGTLVAAEFAARHPERVDRLVLTGGPIISVLDLPNRPFATLKRTPQVSAFAIEAITAGVKPPSWLRRLIIQRPWARRLALRPYTPHPARLDPEAVAAVLAGVGAPGVLPTLFGRWWWRYDLRTPLRHIVAPTLVIAGEDDAIAPVSDAEEFCRVAGTEVTLQRLPDVGHWPMLEAPARFNELVRHFLAEK